MDDLQTLYNRVQTIRERLRSTQGVQKQYQQDMLYLLGQIERRLHQKEVQLSEARAQIETLQRTNQDLIGIVQSLLEAVEITVDPEVDNVFRRLAETTRGLASDAKKAEVAEPLWFGEDAEGSVVDPALEAADDNDESPPPDEAELDGRGAPRLPTLSLVTRRNKP